MIGSWVTVVVGLSKRAPQFTTTIGTWVTVVVGLKGNGTTMSDIL